MSLAHFSPCAHFQPCLLHLVGNANPDPILIYPVGIGKNIDPDPAKGNKTEQFSQIQN